MNAKFDQVIDYFETQVNWHKFFGAVDALYGDKGFKTNGDNFARCSSVEKALAKFSTLARVDQKGYDFVDPFQNKIELKMGQRMFQVRKNPTQTKRFKVKSFLSDKKTVEDFKNETTFDYLLVIDLTPKRRKVILVEDEIARSLYTAGSDGAMIQLDEDHYRVCNIGTVTPIYPQLILSKEIEDAVDRFLNY